MATRSFSDNDERGLKIAWSWTATESQSELDNVQGLIIIIVVQPTHVYYLYTCIIYVCMNIEHEHNHLAEMRWTMLFFLLLLPCYMCGCKCVFSTCFSLLLHWHTPGRLRFCHLNMTHSLYRDTAGRTVNTKWWFFTNLTSIYANI